MSCASNASCTLVGDYPDKTGDYDLPLAERWNGTAWSLLPTPQPRQPTTLGMTFQAVSCTSVRHCIVVGEEFPRNFALHYLTT